MSGILFKLSPSITLSMEKKLVNFIFNAQFSYCPLIWMFHSRIINNKINRIHERCLCLLYEGKSSSFKNLLVQDISVTSHTRNLQILVTEMFKIHTKYMFKTFFILYG